MPRRSVTDFGMTVWAFTDEEVDAYIAQIAPGPGDVLYLRLPGRSVAGDAPSGAIVPACVQLDHHALAVGLGNAIYKRYRSRVSADLTEDELLDWYSLRAHCRALGRPDPPPPYVAFNPPSAGYESWGDVLIPHSSIDMSLALVDTSGGVVYRTIPERLPCIDYGPRVAGNRGRQQDSETGTLCVSPSGKLVDVRPLVLRWFAWVVSAFRWNRRLLAGDDTR